jgi:hypothetical protein
VSPPCACYSPIIAVVSRRVSSRGLAQDYAADWLQHVCTAGPAPSGSKRAVPA